MSTKPSVDWDGVNSDFNYLAKDDDGRLYLYECEPTMGHAMWHTSSGLIGCAKVNAIDCGTCDWTESLVERPNVSMQYKPSINWDHVHPDYKYLARDEDGSLFLYTEEPTSTRCNDVWMSDGESESTNTLIVSPGNCHWQDSLVERP